MSTVDAIFVLQSLINKALRNKRRIYCCFVDYEKAFDSVNRFELWFKLLTLLYEEIFSQVIQSLYKQSYLTQVLILLYNIINYINYLGMLFKFWV